MSEPDPGLQAHLQQLEQEFREGEITEKGYQKRRSILLARYLDHSSVVPNHLGLEDNGITGIRPGEARPSGFLASDAQPDPGSRPTYHYASEGIWAHTEPTNQLPVGMMEREPERPSGLSNLAQHKSTYHRDSLFLSAPGHSTMVSSLNTSREPTMSTDYAFNPATHGQYGAMDSGVVDQHHANGQTRQSTSLDPYQNYFVGFTGQQNYDHQQRDSYGGGPHRYSNSDAFSPTVALAPPLFIAGDFPPHGAIKAQLPLEPRDVPFAVYDPLNNNIPMSKFDNIPSVLRHRSGTTPKKPAFWVLDQKGKEVASITWEKLTSRAEKVAQIIREKSNLYRGDRVALIYRENEVIEFTVALMGCFLAGVVAVPINNQEDYQKLIVILTSTQAHLALTTDNNLKIFEREITTHKLNWPRGVEWWKTDEFRSYHPKKKDDIPPLSVPDLAYIEFSRAPTGDLRGVVLGHKTIMHQVACLSAIISTVPSNAGRQDTFSPDLRDRNGRLVAGASTGETLLSYLDPRQSIGMIMGILLTVYGGHTTFWLEARAVETPGLYANLITKYKATLMLADYPGLKQAAYNYQSDPMATRNFKKSFEPNFSSVKLCLIDTLTVDSEFHEILADRWLKPMRNPRAREVVAPMLCLPEHGGMVISMRDWLGGEERMGCPLNTVLATNRDAPEDKKEERTNTGLNGYSSLIGGSLTQQRKEPVADNDLGEVLLDREALKTNEVVVVASGEEAKKRVAGESGTVRVAAFGFPIPDATLAVVDPETSLLCTPYVVGEIWVDSPSLSGGFWALPKHTENIFHARAYRFEDENPTPTMVDPEFLRTGLLGCVIDGKIFVLGLYEDRLRQKVEWVENNMEGVEYRYFFVQHLILSIMKNVPRVYDCSAFDVLVNDEHLPIVLLESLEASTEPLSSGAPPRQLDVALLDSLSERCIEVLYQEHHLRVYCVMVTAPNALPRVTKNGRKEIGNMLCRREFDNGSLPCVHVKFGVERAVLNLPVGTDPVGGIWSRLSTEVRQESLLMEDKQYSGVDYREVVIDDRTSTPLNNFSTIVDLLQWRVARQADELSYCTVDGRGREGKNINWKKLDTKIAAVGIYLQNKARLRAGDHVILMYTHSEEFVFAVHACFCLGLVAIPMAPLDQNRLNEDAPALLHMIADFRVKAVLVNNDVDHLLKQKPVSQHLKQSATVLRINIPSQYNTTKLPKQSSGCRDLGLTVKRNWVQNWPVLVWTYWTPDQRRVAVLLCHDTIMGTCKVLKETCQMTSSRPVLGCVRSTNGLGFLHTCLMGVFVGAPTYLVSPLDFAQNPGSLFLALSRYKVKDTYATSQMLDHAMNTMPGKGFALHELKNLMIATDGRPRVDVFQKVRLHFAGSGLDRTAINTIYSHVLNPMIATRSYMCIEPIELWLDNRALRQGFVHPVNPEANPSALLIQDSGMVPVSTQIAIVNPENRRLCRVGEYGEIWVHSEASIKGFYGSKDALDAERFNGHTVDGDPHLHYVRTGDLGFLHNVSRPIGPGGHPVDMQVLFVLGAIGETFEINGLSHFPMDVEYTVEKCHRNIVPSGCTMFQAGGLVVVTVEVVRKAYLASMVPVIINAILNGHQLMVDIIAFVSRGDFPRSRLGEKQRGKILAGWVTRKMRTIAQFKIRDSEEAEPVIAEVPENSSDRAYFMREESLMNGSIDHVHPESRSSDRSRTDYAPLPTGISEMPAPHGGYVESLPYVFNDVADDDNDQRTNTTTVTTMAVPTDTFELPDTSLMTPKSQPVAPLDHPRQHDLYQRLPTDPSPMVPSSSLSSSSSSPPQSTTTTYEAGVTSTSHHPTSREGERESNWRGGIWSLPSQQKQHQYQQQSSYQSPPRAKGGLRAVNVSPGEEDDEEEKEEKAKQMARNGNEDEWPRETTTRINHELMSISLGGSSTNEGFGGGGGGGSSTGFIPRPPPPPPVFPPPSRPLDLTGPGPGSGQGGPGYHATSRYGGSHAAS